MRCEAKEGFLMSQVSQNEITFVGLQKFLHDIGFDESTRINNALALHHPESGTLITLSIPTDGQAVRSADLLSVAVRLENQGLVDDFVLQQFRAGKLPKAS